MYITQKAPPEVTSVVNPRRGAALVTPGLKWKDYLPAKDYLFEKFGLSEYVGCLTGEMLSRPVPHVFKTAEVKLVTDLFVRRAPAIYERLVPLIKPPLQTLNRTSRLGWPWFDHPESKKARLAGFFQKLAEEPVSELLAQAFIIMNIRLQPEPRSKKRSMLFVTNGGEVYEAEVNEQMRTRSVGEDLGKHVMARTRLVFNLPVPNLYKQVLDTAIHKVLLSYPVFRHNMFSPSGYLPVSGSTFALDVKHFERHTAEIVRHRAKILGGLYGEIVAQFTSLPFLCPSDDWKSHWMMWPDRDAGWSDQFASGDSAVAPVQKELFLALYQEFAEKELGVSPSFSMDWVLQGGDSRLTIRNYGDDNFWSGDPAVMKQCFQFLSQYLHVEEEDPKRFLGFLWQDTQFRLGASSYLLKTWLNERKPGPPFRTYPYFGWVEKRKVYERYGEPRIQADVFPVEDRVLHACGVPWTNIMLESQRESRLLAGRNEALRNPLWLQGKDYHMTAEEKIATGEYDFYTPEETAPMIKKLLGSEWTRRLR